MAPKRTRSSTTNHPTPEEFLAPYHPEIQVSAQTLRTLVRQTIPNVTEAVYRGWKLIGYRQKEGRRNVYFAYIAPSPAGVALGFEYGFLLTDPEHLLQGNGKQVRFITINSPEDIRAQLFADLIIQAARIAVLSNRQIR
ncbi:MAG: DUF1801 domain-containing protein [Chloroflexi bacterium]|nr:DUF1801 domain-containing protein [Chloroflexota bacterium]